MISALSCTFKNSLSVPSTLCIAPGADKLPARTWRRQSGTQTSDCVGKKDEPLSLQLEQTLCDPPALQLQLWHLGVLYEGSKRVSKGLKKHRPLLYDVSLFREKFVSMIRDSSLYHTTDLPNAWPERDCMPAF